jgi:hypothetical protein
VKVFMSIVLRSLLVVLACAVAQTAGAAPPHPAVGGWELCVDPDGEPKDLFRLEADGTGSVTNALGNTLPLRYSVKASRLTLVFVNKGRVSRVPMTLSADKKKLIMRNPVTKAPALYVRLGNPEQFPCTTE